MATSEITLDEANRRARAFMAHASEQRGGGGAPDGLGRLRWVRRVLRRRARAALQGPVLRDGRSRRRRGAHAGRVPQALGAMGPGLADRGPPGLSVPRGAERLPDATP